MNIHQILDDALGILFVTAMSGLLVGGIVEDGRRRDMRSQVEVVIDRDANDRITNQEWAPVYQYLGLQNSGKHGSDLRVSQLKSFLENYKGH